MKPFGPTPALLFWSVLYQQKTVSRTDLIRDFEKIAGPVLVYSHPYYPMARYYASEMGEPRDLKRLFFVSLRPVEREALLSAKKKALSWESVWENQSARQLNIDPGLLTLENVVLSTAKPYSHRVYLADGIYAELCLIFKQAGYTALPWTYPDYSHEQVIDFFHFLRSFLKTWIKNDKTCLLQN